MSKGVALKTFSLTNKILEVSPQDQIYHFDAEANKKLNREAPWTKEYYQWHPCLTQLTIGSKQSSLLQVMQDFGYRINQDGTVASY
jgi:hypothetical protein